MEENKQIKVAMICHFSNAEVREKLPLGKRRFYKLIRKLFHLPKKNDGYADIAPWDSNIIKCIKERNDIDLYVISAHGGMKKNTVVFDLDGIHYTFIRPEMANFLKRIIPSNTLWRRMNPMTPNIIRRIEKIRPDLVMLVGAENAYYSSSVLSISNYPIFVLCQNVLNNPEYQSGYIDEKNTSTELEIIRNARYMAVYSVKHFNLLRQLGYQNYIFHFNWPIPNGLDITPVPIENKKDYDFINFAMHMSENKGYHDCIRALAIVRQKYPKVRLCLVDGGYDDVRAELKSLISEFHLEDNVAFVPFFAERKDLFQFLETVRFAVLPCKVDYISGTQLQSMEHGLPLVCYKTEGTLTLNKEKKCVLIAEMNDIEDLAEKMIALMDNPELANELIDNSLEFTQKRHDNARGNMQRLVENIKSIIDNYGHDTEIPKEQLFEYDQE